MLKLVFLASVVNCLVLDQQTDPEVLNLILHLQSKVNTLEEDLLALKQNGCAHLTVCQSESKPSFMASLTNPTHCGINQAIIFEEVSLNVGSGYDNRHGVFRAPRNGTYVFGATISASPSTRLNVALVKNNVPIGYLYAQPTSVWQEQSTSIVVQLSAGDDIWVKCVADSNIAGGDGYAHGTYHSHFSGFLISQ